MSASRIVHQPAPASLATSGWYLQAWRQQIAPAQTALLRRAGIHAGERVLDVGCGAGLVTFAAAAAAGRTGAAVGTDSSQVNVDLARARARGIGQVRFERMDAERLELSPGTFDVAISAFALMHSPAPGLALRQMARTLAPGGRIVVAVWGHGQGDWSEVFPIVNAYAHADVCPQFYTLGRGSSLSDLFHETGLTDVASERIQTRLEWVSSDDAVGATLAGGPVAAIYSRFDECTRRSVDGAYLEKLKPWRVGDAYSVPGEFVIVSGRRRGRIASSDERDPDALRRAS